MTLVRMSDFLMGIEKAGEYLEDMTLKSYHFNEGPLLDNMTSL